MKKTVIMVCIVSGLLLYGTAFSLPSEDFIAECKNGNLDAVESMIKKGADVNAVDKLNWTPLHWAAFRGHTEIARLLIDSGSLVNPATKDGSTPLTLARHNKHSELAAFLESRGGTVPVNPFGPNHVTRTPWKITSSSGTYSSGTQNNQATNNSFRNYGTSAVSMQSIKLISIVGNDNRRMALIEYNGRADDYLKGDSRSQAFKVVDIQKDYVVLYSLTTRRQITLRLP